MKEKQEITMLVDRLVKAGERYNSSLKRIGSYLGGLADAIDEILPDELGHIEFTSHGITFRRWKPCHDGECLGPAFWDEEEWALVSTEKTPGSDFYFGYVVASRAARRKAAANILGWFEDFVEFIEKLANETDTSDLEQLVDRVKSIADKEEG